MKNYKPISIFIFSLFFLLVSCDKLDRFPESELRDSEFWNTENDLINAANRLYQELDAYWIDNRADDAVNQGGPNEISNGNRSIPNQSADWNDRYNEIFTANNILEKGGRAQVSDAIKNRYFAEARFFQGLCLFQSCEKIWGCAVSA